MTSRKKPLKIPDAEILAAQANELARLRAERDAAVAGQAELVAALKPFAAYADNGIGTTVDMVITTGSCFAKRQLTMGDCLRASAALSRADAASGKADLEPKEKLGLKQIEAIEKTFGKIEERLDDLRVIAERLACIQEDVPLADNPKDQRHVTTETGVGGILSASHVDRLTGKTHGHSWEVIVWHRCENENDAVVLQNHLANMLKVWDHTILPPELARAEDLAAAILKLSPPSCVEVEIRRPLERIYARVRS